MASPAERERLSESCPKLGMRRLDRNFTYVWYAKGSFLSFHWRMARPSTFSAAVTFRFGILNPRSVVYYLSKSR